MHGNAEEQIEQIIEGTRRVLLRATGDRHESAEPPGLSERFRGCCGLAQCVAGYALQDAGFCVKPIATQSLAEYWHGHAALCVQVDDSAARRYFLIDPTFCQFLASPEAGTPPQPVAHLRQSSEGEAILAALLEAGYVEITPARAAHYVAAFCEGKPVLSAREAFAFLTDPPPHAFHFRREVGSDEFSRENLARRGWSVSQVLKCS